MDNNFNFGEYNSDFHQYRWDDFTIEDEKCARRKFSRYFLALFIYLLVSNAVAVIIPIVLASIFSEAAYNTIVTSVYFNWALQIIAMYVIALPIFLLITKGMRSVTRTKAKLRFADLLIALCIGEAAMYVGNVVGNLINSLLGGILGYPMSDPVEEMIMDTPIYIIIIVAVIIGPIVEELLFRKILMDKLGAYGDRIAILVSAISFGIFHGNLTQMFYATALGAVLAYVYSKTGRLRYPVIIHMAVNFFGSVVSLVLYKNMVKLEELMRQIGDSQELMLERMGEYVEIMSIAGPLSIITLALPVLGLIFFFKKKNQIFVSDRCEIFIPKGKRSSVIILNAGAILFLIICALTVGLNIISPLLEAAGSAA